MAPRAALPPHLVGVLDDAAGPAGDADGPVRPGAAAGGAPAELVGTRLVDDARLSAPGSGLAGVRVTVTVSGGAGALAPAVVWATRSGVDLAGLEVGMRVSDAGDLSSNARRLVAAVDDLRTAGTLGEDVAVHLRPPPLDGAPPSAAWLAALDEVAARDHLLTLGGSGTGAALPATDLAAAIEAALDRELRFACGSGSGPLPAVTRGRDGSARDGAAGVGSPGLLNLLAATRAALDGAGVAEVARVLDQTEPAVLLADVDDAALASARRWCVSVRTADAAGVWSDLERRGLQVARAG